MSNQELFDRTVRTLDTRGLFDGASINARDFGTSDMRLAVKVANDKDMITTTDIDRLREEFNTLFLTCTKGEMELILGD